MESVEVEVVRPAVEVVVQTDHELLLQIAANTGAMLAILQSAVEGLAALTGGGGFPFAPPSEGGFFSGE